MKPLSKSESKYKYWREENPTGKQDRFKIWAKKNDEVGAAAIFKNFK